MDLNIEICHVVIDISQGEINLRLSGQYFSAAHFILVTACLQKKQADNEVNKIKEYL